MSSLGTASEKRKRGPKPSGLGQSGLIAQIYNLLRSRPGAAFSAARVAKLLNCPKRAASVSMLLSRLHHAGMIDRPQMGIYAFQGAIAVPLFDTSLYTKH